MPPSQSVGNDRASATTMPDFETMSSLIEHLTFAADDKLSRAVIREAVREAAPAEDFSDGHAWSDWLYRTLQLLDLRSRLIHCSADQLTEIVRDGARVVTRGDNNSWLAIAERRGCAEVRRSGPENSPEELTFDELRELLKAIDAKDHLQCVVLDPYAAVSPAQPVGLEPLQRLWRLLKPEWSDIWVVVVFALIIGVLALATPIAVETLVNTVAFGRFLQPVIILSLMLLAFLAFSGALRALQTYVVEIIQRRLFARIAGDIAYRLPRVQAENLDGVSTRELVNRFFDVVVVQKVAAQLLLDGVSLVLGTVIGMAMLAFYHPWLLGFDVLLLAMIAVIVFVLGRGAVKSSIKESKMKYSMAAWLEELAGCPTAFRSDHAAQFALERADHLTFEYLTARGCHFRILLRQIIFALAMQAIASTILLGLGGWLVISGQLTLGQLVAAELIVTIIVGSFAKLGKHLESYYDVLASVDKLGALFDLPLEGRDGTVAMPTESNDGVELLDVGYRFRDGSELLRRFSLTIRPGDRVAVTGPAGSGKSTLLDLLFGLRTPSQGRITMHGAAVRELQLDTLRRHIALVRDVEVFDGTVADNVRLGRPHVSRADIRRSLQEVGLLEDALSLPCQLDTRLTSTGHPLTATQLRRLMLARACAGRPSLLLIDGVLDGLPDRDAETLLQWLCLPEQPWKLVLVTGRDSLIAACNRHVELKRVSSTIQTHRRGMPELAHA